MKDFSHLIRVALAFIVVGVGALTLRSFLVPATFGKLGHYRAAAVDDVKAMPVRYAGRSAADSCGACHEDETHRKAAGAHRGVWCETCHGPAGAHVENPGDVKPLKPTAAESRVFCCRCHGDNGSRPKGFPIITATVHYPKTPCLKCHAAHSPRT